MKRNQKGFTLMELMVVIVIVAILAAVAVPLYINYVKDAQLTEAKSAIGAVISAEQAAYQKSVMVGTPTYSSYADLVTNKLVDISEAEINWDFKTTSASETGYVVVATFAPKGVVSDPPVTVTYTFSRPEGGSGGIAEFDK